MASIIHTSSFAQTGDPITHDLGTHEFTAGNRILFFVGMHGTGPAINSIAINTAGGVSTGEVMTKLDDFLITSEAYWELWVGTIPTTGNTYELEIDAASSIAGGVGGIVIETDAAFVELGPSNTGAFSGTVTAMPVITTDREAILLIGAHVDLTFSNLSTIDDEFTAGAISSRQYVAYRYEASGVTTSASITWDGSSETGEALTVSIYLTHEEIRGSFVAGENGTVTSTRTALFNQDGITRTVTAEGSLVVGGNLMLIEQGSAPAGIANAVRLFTEDNGSGKTRLMAQFGTGTAIQLAIEA